MEYYSAIRKDEIMSFAATWMDLEVIILSEERQRKTEFIKSTTLLVKIRKARAREIILSKLMLLYLKLIMTIPEFIS